MTKRKGIILAGGSGTRLYPLTMAVSKQLMPVYDKPMIYYPLTVLMLAGIKDILIITTPHDQEQYKRLLGDGTQWGIKLEYVIQASPDGLAQAFILAEPFLKGSPSAMILGDNIFFGHGLPDILRDADLQLTGGTVFGYHVADPERYGVVEFDDGENVKSIIEKPKLPKSNYAVTGLYFLDSSASERAKKITPSNRGELEITTLLNTYLDDNLLTVKRIGRGYTWLDTGTHSSLLDAANFVRTVNDRQGLQIGSPDEVAFQMKWIDSKGLLRRAKVFHKTNYGKYLEKLAKQQSL